jgi:hypothetical protein
MRRAGLQGLQGVRDTDATRKGAHAAVVDMLLCSYLRGRPEAAVASSTEGSSLRGTGLRWTCFGPRARPGARVAELAL